MAELYEVYTDGACSNNQATGGQPGGWGVIFLDGRKFSGGDISTTNNRMELKAAIEALKNTTKGSEVKLYSDSAYLINAFLQNWIKNWLRNGWVTSQKKPVENQDLWRELLTLEQDRKVDWIKVKGHSENKWNAIADQLAVDAIPKDTGEKLQETDLLKSDEKVFINLSKENYILLIATIKELAKNNFEYDVLYNELIDKF
ncbi:MAG: ribonuclease H [Vulcanibacillus sp.]